MKDLGKSISEARKSKGLTQEELAESAKMNLRTIQRIESNKSEPRGKTLSLICEALEINVEDFQSLTKKQGSRDWGALMVQYFFLLVLNLVLMSIFGYLTLDVEANLNSRFGAVLLSIFLPLFIVGRTPQMSGLERMLKFGAGFMVYILSVLVLHGFPVGFVSGLFVCLILCLGILFYGDALNIHKGK